VEYLEKKCNKCEKTKSLAEMVRCKGNILNKCLACQNEESKKRYKKKLKPTEEHWWRKTHPIQLNLNTTKSIKRYLDTIEKYGTIYKKK